jgi:hypothetical protein
MECITNENGGTKTIVDECLGLGDELGFSFRIGSECIFLAYLAGAVVLRARIILDLLNDGGRRDTLGSRSCICHGYTGIAVCSFTAIATTLDPYPSLDIGILLLATLTIFLVLQALRSNAQIFGLLNGIGVVNKDGQYHGKEKASEDGTSELGSVDTFIIPAVMSGMSVFIL